MADITAMERRMPVDRKLLDRSQAGQVGGYRFEIGRAPSTRHRH